MWDVLLMPLLFTFFGLAARIGAVSYQRTYGKRTNHIWFVYIPLAIALLYGIHWIWQLWQPSELDRRFYLNSGITGKVKVAHYLAFFLPLLALVGVFLYDRKNSPRGSVRAAR